MPNTPEMPRGPVDRIHIIYIGHDGSTNQVEVDVMDHTEHTLAVRDAQGRDETPGRYADVEVYGGRLLDLDEWVVPYRGEGGPLLRDES